MKSLFAENPKHGEINQANGNVYKYMEKGLWLQKSEPSKVYWQWVFSSSEDKLIDQGYL